MAFPLLRPVAKADDGTILLQTGSTETVLRILGDEEGSATPGLRASFKIAASGVELLLTDTNANLNVVLDSISCGPQATDRSCGRTAADPAVWAILDPGPGFPNP